MAGLSSFTEIRQWLIENVLIAKECIVTVHVKVQTDKQLDLGQNCALLRSWKNVVHMVFSGVQSLRIQLDRLCSVVCWGKRTFYPFYQISGNGCRVPRAVVLSSPTSSSQTDAPRFRREVPHTTGHFRRNQGSGWGKYRRQPYHSVVSRSCQQVRTGHKFQVWRVLAGGSREGQGKETQASQGFAEIRIRYSERPCLDHNEYRHHTSTLRYDLPTSQQQQQHQQQQQQRTKAVIMRTVRIFRIHLHEISRSLCRECNVGSNSVTEI